MIFIVSIFFFFGLKNIVYSNQINNFIYNSLEKEEKKKKKNTLDEIKKWLFGWNKYFIFIYL